MQDDVCCPLCTATPKGWKPRMLAEPKLVTCQQCGCRYKVVTFLSYEVYSLGPEPGSSLAWSDELKKLRARALAGVVVGALLQVEESPLSSYGDYHGDPPSRLTSGKVSGVEDKLIKVIVKTVRGEREIAFHRRSGLSLWSFQGEDHYDGLKYRLADENFPYFKSTPRRG